MQRRQIGGQRQTAAQRLLYASRYSPPTNRCLCPALIAMAITNHFRTVHKPPPVHLFPPIVPPPPLPSVPPWPLVVIGSSHTNDFYLVIEKSFSSHYRAQHHNERSSPLCARMCCLNYFWSGLHAFVFCFFFLSLQPCERTCDASAHVAIHVIACLCKTKDAHSVLFASVTEARRPSTRFRSDGMGFVPVFCKLGTIDRLAGAGR